MVNIKMGHGDQPSPFSRYVFCIILQWKSSISLQTNP